jgi:ATP-dependent DNA helicase RecG
MYLNELVKVPVEAVRFFTKRQVGLLKRLGLFTVSDILNYFPYRYDDRSTVESIEKSIVESRPVTVIVQVLEHDSIYFNGKKHPKILVQDEKVRAYLVGFNRSYLKTALRKGERYWLHAQFVYKYNEVQATAFDFEEYREGEPPKNFGMVLPVYNLTEHLYLKELRNIVRRAFELYWNEVEDELPPYVLKSHRLVSKKEALASMHYPKDGTALKKAKLRLAYEEFFAIQLAVLMKRQNIRSVDKEQKYPEAGMAGSVLSGLPFRLTAAQTRAIGEIKGDMTGPKAMHRLLQGDVGCGKTVVAVAAMAMAAGNGHQSAVMAPTEVLAAQHFRSVTEQLRVTGVPTALLTGSTPAAERAGILNDLKKGKISVVIGTHALIQDDVEFKDLALIVFDEQHKFGVEQRIALAKKGVRPDILVMTATPIPRTLTLTLYGDLDITLIDEMPADRKKISTKWILKKEFAPLLSFVEKELENGRQAYFVYPLIEESEKMDTANAVKMYGKLKEHFKHRRLGLLHGKMNPADKFGVIESFRKGELDILVSTTVIEVGIDVRNASVMVIEGADRFGLSQLHQLRGRVGRGEYPSYCIMVGPNDMSDEAKKRLDIMASTTDGFKIAEEDLRMRGPGEMLGVRQSGLPELKIADYLRDEKLFLVAKQDALNILKDDPALEKEANRPLKDGIIRSLPADYLYSG